MAGKLVLEAVPVGLTKDSRVDPETGIITGVKVLGSQSRNKRIYPPALLAQRYAAYEGAQVYADHDYAQLRHGKTRPLADWGGVLRVARHQGNAIMADLHCLKETPAGRIILEAARTCSDRFGLSPMHLIEAEKGADGVETVTAILEVWSVDAVTRPATTRTLFEEDQSMAEPSAPAALTVEGTFVALQSAVMTDPNYDDAERLAVLRDVMKLKGKVLGTDEGTEAGVEVGASATEESATAPAPAAPRGGLAVQVKELGRQLRVMSIRQLAAEQELTTDAPALTVLLVLPSDAAVAAYLTQLRQQRRPRYSPGPARSQGRRVATEGLSSGLPQPIPRLTAGADREAVKRHYRE